MTPELLQTALSRALSTACGRVVDLPAAVTLTRPKTRGQGDWTSNIALQAAALVGADARELAAAIAARLRTEPGVDGASVSGPGFVNVSLDASAGARLAAAIVAAGDDYGRPAPDPATADHATADSAAQAGATAPGATQAHPVPGLDSIRYAHARAMRIDRLASAAGVDRFAPAVPTNADDPSSAAVPSTAEAVLLTALTDFPRAAAQGRLVGHLPEVAEAFHRWADAHPVTPTVDEQITAVHAGRLTLNRAAAVVLRNGLRLLGETAPERM